jgi:hypothetical protein
MEVNGELHAPAAYPRERAPGTHWIGGRVGPRAVLDAVVKRKIPSPRRESNPALYRLSYRGSQYSFIATPTSHGFRIELY